jgi:hypothetical protein
MLPFIYEVTDSLSLSLALFPFHSIDVILILRFFARFLLFDLSYIFPTQPHKLIYAEFLILFFFLVVKYSLLFSTFLAFCYSLTSSISIESSSLIQSKQRRSVIMIQSDSWLVKTLSLFFLN